MAWHDHRGHCVEKQTPVEDKNEEQEILDESLPDFPVLDVNHSRRYYNNGEYTDNGVRKEHLADHIQYNKKYRPGTALFINGVCLNYGYLGQERCDKLAELIKGLDIKVSASQLPYR